MKVTLANPRTMSGIGIANAQDADHLSILAFANDAAAKAPQHRVNFTMKILFGMTRMITMNARIATGTQLGASNMKAKADLVAAMKSSIAECEKAFAGFTDATVVQMATGGRGGPRSRLASLYGMVAHDNEEYGYLAVQLRLKGIVPPSSEGGPMK